LILFLEKYFNRLFWILCLGIFAIIALRAFLVPFSHDEAATFFFYIQSDNYLPYKAHVYTNNHFLNSTLSNICFHLAGSHRFVLRLPNVLSFIVLCFGVLRHFKYLTSFFSKLILITFFILTINFIEFFELCRGYGLSLGFMVLGLVFLLDYFTSKNIRYFLLFSVCWQFALAANLVLVVVFTIIIAFVCVFQVYNHLFFKLKNIVLQVVNISLLFFWIKFSFFYREKGVLDSGVGDDYWVVSFKSLIAWIFGTENGWIQILCILLFVLMMLALLRFVLKNKGSLNNFFQARFFYPSMLLLLIMAFYLQKKILHVNFPEDRTGLFFYIFYVLSFAFLLNDLPKIISQTIASILFISTGCYFLLTLNFSNFSSYFYQTMPKGIYDMLKSEYDQRQQIFSIGGHRVRELNYAFLNYRGGSVLNHMDDSEQMRMNCDYYFAMKREKPYYQFFYDEIAEDKKWDRVLLKRKEKIVRKEIYNLSHLPLVYKGNQEFFEFLRVNDSSFTSKNCLEVDIEIQFNKVPKPLNSFLVFSIDNRKNENIYYKRIPLNWIAYDLNNTSKYFKLTCGKIPNDFGSLVVYLWNIDKEDLTFTLKNLRLQELHAKGINIVIPESFYPLIEKTTKQPLL
jgi:hypothetical protein